MKRLICIFSAAICLIACDKRAELIVPQELGVKEGSVSLPCTAGSFDINVLSDGDFTLSLDNSSWLSLDGDSRSMTGSGDVTIRINYQMNRSVIRSAVVGLDRGNKHIEVPVSQAGVLTTGVEFESRSVTLPAQAGSHSVKVITLCQDSDLDFIVDYNGPEGWISDFRKANNFLVFSVIENTEERLRSASLKLCSKTDPNAFDVLQISQLPSGGSLVTVGFDKLADIAAGTLEAEGLCLEGVIITDNSQGNGAPNANVSPSVQDNTLSGRTTYLQAADGSAGVMIVFDTEEDNFSRRYDAATFLLDGTTVEAFQNPTRYVIKGATAQNLISTKAGSSFDVVKKEKHISELTDEDIYTFVTLLDCEIPIRKGPFVPIDLRLKSVINRYPMVIRDIQGSTMHLMTNLTAAWQRDGKGLPQGSGSISGILVHETCDNFEWDVEAAREKAEAGLMEDYITDIGDIGPYQIRPVTREEIDLADDFEDGFSKLIMEIRYFCTKPENLVANVSGNTIYSTYPPVANPITDPTMGKLEKVGGVQETTIDTYRDWTLLGPLVDGVIRDPSAGNGVYDFYGRSAQFTVSSYAQYGQLVETVGSAWRDIRWSTTKYWQATFNTKELDASNLPLSVQFGVCGGLGEVVGGPRYWVAEYSSDGKTWKQIGSYTVPDFPIQSNRKAWQCPGYKYISFTLPYDQAMVGKDKVYVRMHPSENKAGTADSYDGGKIDVNLKSQLNYFAIRCNK